MKNPKLNLQELEVDSFETLSVDQSIRGTVHGNDDDGHQTLHHSCEQTCRQTYWWENTCAPNYTCANHSCWFTAPDCHCAVTDGECTNGPQDTCMQATCPG